LLILFVIIAFSVMIALSFAKRDQRSGFRDRQRPISLA
jgi:hypothetical protein